MQNLQTAIMVICLAAAALTLAEGLVPDHRFEKQIRLIFSAVLMTVMLKPLTEIRLQGTRRIRAEPEAGAAELTELAEQAKEQAVCESIRSALNQELCLKEIPCEVTEVSAHIGTDGSIVISEVAVTGNLLSGSACLREWLGPDIEITEGGE